jgi:DNA processing protein
MDNREAWIVLNSISGIGPVRASQLLSIFGEPRRVLAAPEKELAQVSGIGEVLAPAIAGWRKTVDLKGELELAHRAGVCIITRDDPEYPERLRDIHDPPLCLYVRGDAPAVFGRLRQSLAIVGSRHTTTYGVGMAQNLASAASLAGWVVVSGLARGIDTVAHQAAVATKGCTIAVLGSGLAHLYPQENTGLARAIVEAGGALVSEFPMRFPPDRRAFPMRNRIISGLTAGTLVVEAGIQSGSLITAAQALEQGRAVFAVPGRVDSPQSRGCHALLKDGAALVENFADILAELETLPGLRPPRKLRLPAGAGGDAEADGAESATPAPEEDFGALTELERKLVGHVRHEGECAIDSLIAGIGEPAHKVLSALVALEMRRVLTQLPGKRVTLRAARG